MEVVVETPQTPAAPAGTVAPVESSVETSTQPEQQVGQEGTEKKVENEETPQKRESRRQRQLNRERERRIAAETEARLIRERLEKLERGAQPKQEAADDAPKREQFQDYESFIEARATWRAEKAAEEKARKILEESRNSDKESRDRETQSKQIQEWNAKLEKARDAVEDFDEVCAESEAIVTPPMASAIQESDHGALIAYHLAKNPAEAERISKLSPSKQAAAIVALEDKVAKPAKQPSKAPEPINPVGKKAEVTEKDPARMTDEEYAAWRRERRARR